MWPARAGAALSKGATGLGIETLATETPSLDVDSACGAPACEAASTPCPAGHTALHAAPASLPSRGNAVNGSRTPHLLNSLAPPRRKARAHRGERSSLPSLSPPPPSLSRMRFSAPVLGLLALGAAGPAAAGRSLAQDSSQALAEWGAMAPASAPAPAPPGSDASAPLAPITTCTVTASSAVNRTEVDGSHAVAQQGPMAVPDAFLGTALLSVHAPEGSGSEAVVEVVPAAGHERVAPGGKATDAVAETPPLKLTTLLAANGTGLVSYQARSYANDLTPQAVFVNGMPCEVVLASASVPPPPQPSEETIPGLASFVAERPLTTRDGAIIGTDGKPLTVRGVNWFGYENGQTNPDGLWGNVGNGACEKMERVCFSHAPGLLFFRSLPCPAGAAGPPALLSTPKQRRPAVRVVLIPGLGVACPLLALSQPPPPPSIHPTILSLFLLTSALVADFVNVVWRMQLMGFNTIRLPFSFQQFESAAPKV